MGRSKFKPIPWHFSGFEAVPYFKPGDPPPSGYMAWHDHREVLIMSRIEQSIVTITPAGAKNMLAACIPGRNRPLRKRYVEYLAEQMKAGRWQLNGEAIIADEEHNILDGQHRLAAVVLSGVPIRCLLVRNVQPGAFTTIDQGKPRSASDVLHMAGRLNTNNLAAALRILYRIKAGYGNFVVAESNLWASADELLALSDQHPGLSDYVSTKGPWTKVGNAAFVTLMRYLCDKIDHDKAEPFFAKLATGADARVSDPAHILRERLISARTSSCSWKLSPTAAGALIVKAWNIHHEGRRVSKLIWSNREAFPSISGLTQKILDGKA